MKTKYDIYNDKPLARNLDEYQKKVDYHSEELQKAISNLDEIKNSGKELLTFARCVQELENPNSCIINKMSDFDGVGALEWYIAVDPNYEISGKDLDKLWKYAKYVIETYSHKYTDRYNKENVQVMTKFVAIFRFDPNKKY